MTILLIDGNSIAHAHHQANKLTVGDMQVQAIFGVLKSMNAMMRDAPPRTTPFVLWDGKAQFRFDIFPDYKGNRKPLDQAGIDDKEAFKRQSPFTEKLLSLLGVAQYRHPLLEADDLAHFFVQKFLPLGRPIKLVSGDKDWLQLVQPGVEWHDPIRVRGATHSTFLEFTGYFTTQAFVQGKALQGDTTDNIEGIEGIGKGTAPKFLAEWKDVNRFFAAVDNGTHKVKTRASKTAKSPHPEEILASPEGRALFERNLALMDMARAPNPIPPGLIALPKTPDAGKFQMLCERLAFASILRERHSFLRNFNLTATA